jgi:DNA-binding HxlR family transcriptional regulator
MCIRYIFWTTSIKLEVLHFFSRGSLKIDILARKGTMRVLCALADRGAMSFTEFRRLVGSPTTTSKCLRGLVEAGLMKREIQADRYRSVRYSLTERGAKVAKLVKELEKVL